MKISNEMLDQIQEWISQDKIIVTKNKRLKELSAKHQAVAREHRRAELDLFHKTFRAIKKLETQMNQAAMAIGKRRGYLRYHFEQKFVLVAQRERVRMERKKPFTAE